MSRERIDVPQVLTDLEELVELEKAGDPRVARGLPGRYMEHGEPCCLVARLMFKEGISSGQLKALDHAEGRLGGGQELFSVKGPIKHRYTPKAWDLLLFLQKCNDRGWSWDWCRKEALTVSRYFFTHRHLPAYRDTHTWITRENVLEIRGA